MPATVWGMLTVGGLENSVFGRRSSLRGRCFSKVQSRYRMHASQLITTFEQVAESPESAASVTC
jgi:hypothetical protein